MIDTVILDVDGTLVDSSYHHALAWSRAFGRHDLHPPLWRIHRAIGMGGDKLVAEVAGQEVEDRLGDELRERWTEEFDRLIGEVRPFAGTRALLVAIRARGLHVVLASSGQPRHVETFLDLFDGRSLADAWTTAEDAEESKPAADLLVAALDRVHGTSAVMVGDAAWDAEAANAAHLPSIGLRTGGFSEEELCKAGASAVFDGPQELADAVKQGLLDRF
ncbi:HAD family hydrolase [Terrabacter sp. C0L_2]|uniref:HAD family hydrolase n=1 Tax=Terrabacter sp. C0L_2 TaxID=3108389 RepID=UPI002ECFB636|nr:HAD family hydrolase [Terrabacter sp. C0L_2]